MTVRRFSAEEKRTIVPASLSGGRMAEVCREHQVSAPTVYQWRDRFLEGGSKALAGDTPSKREALLERENARLRDVVAELILANDVLKKGSRGNGGGGGGAGGGARDGRPRDRRLPRLRPRGDPPEHAVLRAAAAGVAPLQPGDPHPGPRDRRGAALLRLPPRHRHGPPPPPRGGEREGRAADPEGRGPPAPAVRRPAPPGAEAPRPPDHGATGRRLAAGHEARVVRPRRVGVPPERRGHLHGGVARVRVREAVRVEGGERPPGPRRPGAVPGGVPRPGHSAARGQ